MAQLINPERAFLEEVCFSAGWASISGSTCSHINKRAITGKGAVPGKKIVGVSSTTLSITCWAADVLKTQVDLFPVAFSPCFMQPHFTSRGMRIHLVLSDPVLRLPLTQTIPVHQKLPDTTWLRAAWIPPLPRCDCSPVLWFTQLHNSQRSVFSEAVREFGTPFFYFLDRKKYHVSWHESLVGLLSSFLGADAQGYSTPRLRSQRRVCGRAKVWILISLLFSQGTSHKPHFLLSWNSRWGSKDSNPGGQKLMKIFGQIPLDWNSKLSSLLSL